MHKKLFLLDAMALVYRAYYALIRSTRLTSTGKNTNAQFGFTTTLYDLIQREKPTHMAVCFDTHAPTDRHIDFTDYKANRQETPEDILQSLPDIKQIIEGFNIPAIGIDGYEADDVIGALAQQAAAVGYDVYMVTPDKDYGQLVTDHIKIYKPSYQNTSAEILGPKEICEKWNIKNISQVVDMLGLMGDAVDNIPGIAGVGEKTAAKLLAEYETLENVLANAKNIKGSLGEKIRAGVDAAIMSKKLATIIVNVPVEFDEEAFRLKPFNKETLQEIFTTLEFKTLGKRILGEDFNVYTTAQSTTKAAQMNLFGTIVEKPTTAIASAEIQETNSGITAEKNISNTPHQYQLVQTEEAISALLYTLQKSNEICFDTETTGIDANNVNLVGMSFCIHKSQAYYVPFPDNKTDTQKILNTFKIIFDNPNILWVGQNIKYDLLVLKWYGINIQGNIFDTMLAHYVIEPEARHGMDLLSAQYLSYEPIHIESLIGKKRKNQGNMRDVELEKIKEYAAEDADITLQLKQIFELLLEQKSVKKVFDKVEAPLVKVLTDMEYEGIKIDVDFLNDYAKELSREAKQCEENVYKQAGVTFNLSSPKQLGEVLFDKLQLDPKAKKTKTGQYATGEDVLLKLAHQHQIIADILAYRQLTKLISTYVEVLPGIINPKTGRVHTSYAQAVAVTGRLSSNNPNLQNIPIRTEKGREIRKAFIPRNNEYVLMSADYSQIELRIVAAISGDESMCDAFKQHKDIHTATAAKVYNIEEAAVTKEMRYKAKSVNFGIIYGQGAFGLSENLGISRTEAKQLIDNYFKQYPVIEKYMDDMVAFAKKHTYAETLMGRKRWLKDIHSTNNIVRSYAERNAINSPIQGSAADMIKLAMISIHKAMQAQKLQSKMLLQVHDELVFDAHRDEIDILKPLIIKHMQQAMVLPNQVPVIAEVGVGKNWLEAH